MSDDAQLPGEMSRETQLEALRVLTLDMFSNSIHTYQDDFFATVAAVVHAEWERRYGGKWVLADEEAKL